jgi:hypothetical protein
VSECGRIASWRGEEADASCATSVQASETYMYVIQKSRRPAKNESFVCEQVEKALTIKMEESSYLQEPNEDVRNLCQKIICSRFDHWEFL